MKKRRGQTNWFRVFYYSHPYLVIFNILIIYNLVLIALAAWLMTWLMHTGETARPYNFSEYLTNLEYCTVFTMNSGGIYDNAPDSVIIMKIILSVIQMITFTGALVGLATSMLQGVFDRRAHNVGRLRLKNHYVILNWSPAGANLIRELSFLPGRKTVVILSSESRDEINEEIDNIFLETGTERKNITVFVKEGKPGSRKALREISVAKAKSVALLVPRTMSGATTSTDVDTFKLLMGIVSLTHEASIAIEAVDEEKTHDIEDLIKASPELAGIDLTVFSVGSVVGHVLARSAINSSFADLYYSILTYQNGGFYEISPKESVEEAMKCYKDCIPVSRYENGTNKTMYAIASGPTKVFKTLGKKDATKEIPYKKKPFTNSFVLFVIGKNDRSESIEAEVSSYNESKLGMIDCRVYPFSFNLDVLLEEINSTVRRKKILILSDENADADHVDVNVFQTILDLKASKKLPKDVEISAELLDQSNRQSLATLNVTSVISNQMVALYLVQLMTHPDTTGFYQGLLSSKTDFAKSEMDIDIRYAEELFDFNDTVIFDSRAEFIQSVYKASSHEYIPIGFVGGAKQKKAAISSVTGMVTNVVGKTISTAVDLTRKTISTVTDMGAALNMEDMGQMEATLDINSRIMLLSDGLRKKEKVILEKGMIIILIHHPEN